MVSEVATVADRVRDAMARGDIEAVAEHIDRRPLEVWYGLSLAELQDVVPHLPPSSFRLDRPGAFLLAAFSPVSYGGLAGGDPAVTAAMEASPQLRQWYQFAQAAQARLQGDPVRAHETMRALPDVAASVPMLVDTSRGSRQFLLLQSALTAALAGDVAAALGFYDRVLLAPAPPRGLSFFVREAYVRSALLHALWGDPAVARTRIAQSGGIARTDSWVEHLVDADLLLTEALLAPPDEADAALERVLAVPPPQLGEMWPFFVVVVHRVALAAGRAEVARDRIAGLEAAGLAPQSGSGLPASVFCLEQGLGHLLEGRPARARESLDGADPALVQTQLMLGLHALVSGAHSRALHVARGARAKTRGLRQSESRRLAVVAAAHYLAGEHEDAGSVLGELAPTVAPADLVLLDALSPEFSAFARDTVAGWPQRAGDSSASAPLERAHLTARELDVLVRLADGKSRAAIAEDLYLSANTVKSHQRSLYRKLGVSSIGEAIIEGSRLGWL